MSRQAHLRSKQTLGEGKQIRSALYENDGRFLFVPTESMLLLHAAGRPVEVLRRASQPVDQWQRWAKEFATVAWVPNWLYGDQLPDGVKLFYPAWERQGKTRPDGAFVYTAEMRAFREAAKPAAVARAAAAQPGATTRRGDPDIDPTKALARYGHLPWFAGWLLRGEPAPDTVTVPTAGQLQRARAAWNYTAHRKAAGVSETAFERWFWRDRLPAVPRPAFVRWLYGGPAPDGWTVIGEAMQRLHGQRTPDAIAKAAGSKAPTVWVEREDWEVALREALKKATRADAPEPSSDAWQALDPRMRRAMWKYAQAANLGRCCERAKVAKQEYFTAITDCRRRSGEAAAEALRWYLDGGHERRIGEIAPRLFLPSEGMLAFRRIASAAAAENGTSELLRTLPAADQWMLEWCVPIGTETLPDADPEPAPVAESRKKKSSQVEREPIAPAHPVRISDIDDSVLAKLIAALQAAQLHASQFDQVPAVDDEEEAILRHLGKSHPRLQTADQVKGFLVKIGERTIRARMNRLQELDLISYPKGRQHGASITPLGLKLLSQL